MQITNIIESERAAKRADYLKLWAEVPENRRLPLSTEQYLLNFGAETVTRTPSKVRGLM